MKHGGGGEHTAWSYIRVNDSRPTKAICMNTKCDGEIQTTDCIHMFAHEHMCTFTFSLKKKSGSKCKCILWSISSCTFLPRDILADRGVCHLKVFYHGVNCFQTPASVWDYSSHSWLLGWAPKPILICLYANSERWDLVTVAAQVSLTYAKMW